MRDRGIGIPARDLERIFERFYRVDHGRSRRTGGTGLGLAIVRHVASNHGGSCRVESREGVGSIFTMRLPLAPKDGATSISTSIPSASGASGSGPSLFGPDDEERREALDVEEGVKVVEPDGAGTLAADGHAPAGDGVGNDAAHTNDGADDGWEDTDGGAAPRHHAAGRYEEMTEGGLEPTNRQP